MMSQVSCRMPSAFSKKKGSSHSVVLKSFLGQRAFCIPFSSCSISTGATLLLLVPESGRTSKHDVADAVVQVCGRKPVPQVDSTQDRWKHCSLSLCTLILHPKRVSIALRNSASCVRYMWRTRRENTAVNNTFM